MKCRQNSVSQIWFDRHFTWMAIRPFDWLDHALHHSFIWCVFVL